MSWFPHHFLNQPVPQDFNRRRRVIAWQEENPRHAWALDQMREHHRVKRAIKNYLYYEGRLPYETMDLLWEFANRIEWEDKKRPYAPPTEKQLEREYYNQTLRLLEDDRRKV
jgi:hypothetical protein